MNRLILLGNGFDLAHGLKTSYCHFFVDLLKDKIKETIKYGSPRKGKRSTSIYKNFDDLIEVTAPNSTKSTIFADKLLNITSLEELLKLIEHSNIRVDFLNPQFSLLKRTLDEVRNYNWVDIEDLYFEILVETVKDVTERRLPPEKRKLIDKVNKELLFIKNQLEIYLNKESESLPKFDNVQSAHFWDSLISKSAVENIPERIHIVNFNYTNTLNQYCKSEVSFSNPNAKIDPINYIHGNLIDPGNPIIFGYGDDSDDEYDRLVKLDYPNLMKNIKPNNYLNSSNLNNLLKFMGSGEFEVYIIGHSCGRSDKGVFQIILNNEDCIRVETFSYNNDYEEKATRISNYFANRQIGRSRIVTKDLSRTMNDIQIPNLLNKILI